MSVVIWANRELGGHCLRTGSLSPAPAAACHWLLAGLAWLLCRVVPVAGVCETGHVAGRRGVACSLASWMAASPHPLPEFRLWKIVWTGFVSFATHAASPFVLALSPRFAATSCPRIVVVPPLLVWCCCGRRRRPWWLVVARAAAALLEAVAVALPRAAGRQRLPPCLVVVRLWLAAGFWLA